MQSRPRTKRLSRTNRKAKRVRVGAPSYQLEPHQIIVRPIVTEKGTHQSTHHNAYCFEVHPMATKTQIRAAIETLFPVRVVGVRPMATVLSHGVSSGSQRRTVVLDVYRDGEPGAAALEMRWADAVYDWSGPTAYRLAARILGDGVAAESVVEQAFREILLSGRRDPSVSAAGAALEGTTVRLANEALANRRDPPSTAIDDDPVERPALESTALQIGGVRTVLSRHALTRLLSSQREALELSVLENLKVRDIAERMQTTPTVVHRRLRDALLAVGSGEPPSPAVSLARWRGAEREWASLPSHHRDRPERGIDVAHAWLDYQVTSRALRAETVVLVTDAERRFVATSGDAARTFGRPSVVGLRIDEVTAPYARPLVPELWTLFDANGSMDGEYDCDRPGALPIRTRFHGVWGRPLPVLQVGYLRPPVPAQATPVASI